MTHDKSSLWENIRIGRKCSVSWDSMTGDEKVRHCGKCNLNVYNLIAMTQEQAEALILEKEGNLCARIFRRADGTIMTSDCPKMPLNMWYIGGGAVASILLTAYIMGLINGGREEAGGVRMAPCHQKTWVVRPVKDIRAGTKLRLEDFEEQRISDNHAPADHVHSARQLAGKRALKDLHAMDILIMRDFE